MATSMQYMNGHVPGLQPSTAGQMSAGQIPASQMSATPQMPYGLYGMYGAGTGMSAGMSGSNGMAFSFRQRFDRVDWKKLASADVDSISRTLDFNTLQDNIMNVAFCNIEAEVDVRLMDPNFLKLFKIAQLTIEYLLHSQDYLSGMVQGLEEKLRKAMEEHSETSRQLERQQQELTEVKKESHKRKKMLVAQQHIINNGNTNNYNKCPYCTKGFVNQTFMQAHLMRRHSEQISQLAASNQQSSQQGTTQPAPSGTTETQSSVNESVERELEEMRERLRLTESQLTEERNLRNTTLKRENTEIEKVKKDNKRQLDSWKQKFQEQKHETERLQSMYQKELREMAEKQMAAQRSLEQIQGKSLSKSNLGAMIDDDDGTITEAQLLRQQREEVAILKEQLNQKLSASDQSLRAQYTEQEEQWKAHMAAMAEKHKQDLKKLEEQLHKVDKKKKQETVETVEIIETTETKTVTEQKKHLDVPTNDVQDFSYSSPEPTARSKTPEPVKKSTEPAMFVESDPEDFSDSEEEGELLHEKTDLNSTMGTTLGQTSGTLTTLSGTWHIKSCRLLEQLKRDPNLVLAIKDELRDMLDNSLERRGIAKGTTGISDKMLEKQLFTTKAERQKAAAKLPSIYDIRQNYITQMENTAREQYKKQRKEFSASAPVLPTQGSGSSNLQRTHSNSSNPLNHATTLERSTPKPTVSAGVPKPAPRSSRDPNRSTLGSTISGASFTQTSTNGVLTTKSATSLTGTSMTGASYTGTSYTSYTGTLTDTGQSMGTTMDSTGRTFDSDESDSYTETENQDQVDGTPSPTPRKPRNPVVCTVSNNTTNDEDDSVWDNASDLDDITPRDPLASNSLPQAKIISSPIGTPKPKGKLVASLTAEIESQLANRGKKPAGGKNTMASSDDDSGKGSRRGRRSTGDEEDDDDFSISSLEEDSLVGKNNGIQRRTPMRNSGAETDMSSNTLGTSMWGSSKDKPTPNPRKSQNQSIDYSQASTGAGSIAAQGNHTQGSAGRTSRLSVSDFDSTLEDLKLDDL